MKRESIHSGQRVRYSDGKPSGVWTVVAIAEQVVLQAASGRRLAQADELQPADVAEEHPLPVEDATPAPVASTISDLTDRQLQAFENAVDLEFDAVLDVAVRLLAEVRRHRTMVKRLEEMALSLEHAYHPDMRKIGAELRNRMRGDK